MAFEDGYQIPALEKDGKIVVTPFPATDGFQTWFAGAFDKLGPPLVRGGGTPIRLSWTSDESRGAKTVEGQFGEPVELHDGEATYVPKDGGWTMEDKMNVSIVLPATVTQASGAGNCNRVATGLGFDVIVPAAGDGGFDVDLNKATPVPAPKVDGYWDVDHFSGKISPSTKPGKADWHLLSIDRAAHYVRNVSLGHPLGEFDIDAYKAQYVHQSWIIRITVTKQSDGPGEFAGWLLAFREHIE